MRTNIKSSTINLMEALVFEHYKSFIELRGKKLTFKHHVLTHYPGIMKEFGPLNNMSSMRPEAFHSLLKRYTNVVRNRINLSYSLANRYQLSQTCMFLKIQHSHL